MKYNMATIKRTKDKELKDEMYMRYFAKNFKKQKPKKPIKSLQDDWRGYQKEGDYEAWTEYGFFEAEGMTDEEIDEAVEEMKIRPAFPAWDCSGLTFTLWITWHRNPCGWISVIHRKAVDL